MAAGPRLVAQQGNSSCGMVAGMLYGGLIVVDAKVQYAKMIVADSVLAHLAGYLAREVASAEAPGPWSSGFANG